MLGGKHELPVYKCELSEAPTSVKPCSTGFVPGEVETMAYVSSTVLTIFFGIVGLYVIKRLRSSRDDRPLPPGPKGIPFLGNVNDMPKPGVLECHHWLTHKELYGAYALAPIRPSNKARASS